MSKNICKFTPRSLAEPLSVSCFVLETDQKVMEKQVVLKEHRAILILRGNGAFEINNETLSFDTGELHFAFSGESFSIKQHQNTEYIYIGFSGDRADELLNRFSINAERRCFESFDGLIPFWSESLARANEQTIDLAAESMLLYTFSRLFPVSTQQNDLVAKIVAITEDQFTDHELSISTVAKQLSYNPKYLSHAFKSKMGVSYSDYLTSIRIKYAISLFNRGIDSVKNVALLSGFSDPLYFSTVFKKQIGLSPVNYIKKGLQK